MANLTLQPNNPFDRLYKLFILACLIVLVIIISDMFKSCHKSEHDTDISPIKERIKADIKRKDSVKEVIVYRDSIRTKYITKWRVIRHDSLIPCETKLIACDTLLITDSLLISDLKHEIKISDNIILKQDSVIVKDSIQLTKANKALVRQKVKTKLALIVAALFGGLAIVR